MAISEIFPNPTVKQVIFQIRYPNLFYIENKIGEFQQKIMSKFPESALLFRRQILITDSGSQVKEQPQSELGRKIWQFKSPLKYELNVLSDSFDISSMFHKTYNNPDAEYKFRDIIEFVLNNFLEIVGMPIINRVGLRYIDECPIPEKTNTKFKEYYNSTFPLERFNIDQAHKMEFSTEISRGAYNLRFVESLQEIDGKHKLILDFDGFAQNISTDKCMETTDLLHKCIIDEYERSIKGPVYSYMRKKE